MPEMRRCSICGRVWPSIQGKRPCGCSMCCESNFLPMNPTVDDLARLRKKVMKKIGLKPTVKKWKIVKPKLAADKVAQKEKRMTEELVDRMMEI